MFVIENGPEQEWFTDKEEAIENALEWSADLGGETITISRVKGGKTYPLMEVFA